MLHMRLLLPNKYLSSGIHWGLGTYSSCLLLPQTSTLGYHILQGKSAERWETLGQGTLEKTAQPWVCARWFEETSMGFSLWVDPVRKKGWFYLWGLKALNRREGRLDTVYWSISCSHLWQTARGPWVFCLCSDVPIGYIGLVQIHYSRRGPCLMLVFHGTALSDSAQPGLADTTWPVPVLRLLFLSPAPFIKVSWEDLQSSNTGFQVLTSSKASTLEALSSHDKLAGSPQSRVS